MRAYRSVFSGRSVHPVSSVLSFASRCTKPSRTLRWMGPPASSWATTTVRYLIAGRATPEGTRKFLEDAALPMHHEFMRSKLMISPIIHGPPSEIINGPDEDSNLAVVQAFIHNRSNCVYVYNHFSQGPWFTPQVAHLVEGGVPREAIVAVADLGYADTREVLAARLKDACKCSGLKQIDFAIVRANEYNCNSEEDSPGAGKLNESIDFLEHTCKSGQLTAYGLRIDVLPYNLHTPMFSEENVPNLDSMGAVPSVEGVLLSDETPMPHCDMVMYEISPSSAYPASWSMLRANPEDIEANEDVFGEEDLEKRRKHTRIAVNPLTCYFGWGDGSETSEHHEERLENRIDPTIVDSSYGRDSVLLYSALYDEVREKYIKGKLDSLCPKLEKSKTLEERALRIVMSVGVDAVVLDSDLSAAIGKFRLKPRDMLASRDTDDVFGAFYISPEEVSDVEGAVRDGEDDAEMDERQFEEFEKSLQSRDDDGDSDETEEEEDSSAEEDEEK